MERAAAVSKRSKAEGLLPEIGAVKDPVVRGYACACDVRPWKVHVDGVPLLDKRGRPRRFTTERAAIAAARRSIR